MTGALAAIMRAIVAVLTLFIFASPAPALTLHRGNAQEPDTLDPHRATAQWEGNIIGDMLMGLLTEDAAGEPIPGMAESYETSDDGLVWTFHIRADAVWSDGVPVTAGDFVFALRRINDPKTAAQYASLTHVLKNAHAVSEGALPPESVGAREIDDKTLELTLEHPAPYLPHLLMHYTMFPLPRHVVGSRDDWVKPGVYVSNGPYVLAEYRPNDFVRLVKNPRFFDAANVAIDEVRFYGQDDQLAGLKRFRAGEFDTVSGVPGQMIPELRRSDPESLRIAPMYATSYLIFNLTRDTWKDVRIRTALSLAIDRETIVKRIMGGGEAAAIALVPPGIPNYPHTARLSFADHPLAQRQAMARALLVEAGYGPDNPLEFVFIHNQVTDTKRVAVALQSMWKAVGVEMTPQAMEGKGVTSQLRAYQFDVAWGAWVADYPDATNYLYLSETRAGEMNRSRYSNPAFDALVLQAESQPEIGARGDMLARAEQLMLDDAPLVPVYHSVSRNLVASYVMGWEASPDNVHRTRWLTIDEGRRR